MNISLYEAETIATAANADLRTDYSGRGMYGAQCVGFDVDSTRDAMRLSIAISRTLDDDEAEAMIERLTTDSMGLGLIVYFPGVTVRES